jgi:DNA transformation protein and related proteins
MARPIAQVRNIGLKLAKMLREIEVPSEEALAKIGPVTAYVRLRFAFGKEVGLNALWAMEAGLSGLDWRQLPDDRKAALKEEITLVRERLKAQPSGEAALSTGDS